MVYATIRALLPSDGGGGGGCVGRDEADGRNLQVIESLRAIQSLCWIYSGRRRDVEADVVAVGAKGCLGDDVEWLLGK